MFLSKLLLVDTRKYRKIYASLPTDAAAARSFKLTTFLLFAFCFFSFISKIHVINERNSNMGTGEAGEWFRLTAAGFWS